MKSELQEFIEKILAGKNGDKVEVIITTQITKEITGIVKITDVLNTIGIPKLMGIYNDAKKGKENAK